MTIPCGVMKTHLNKKSKALCKNGGKIGEHTDSEAQTFSRESAESAEELIDVLNLANRNDKSYSELLKKIFYQARDFKT